MRGIDRGMITVGICTYKRPHLLEKLLLELDKQYTGDLFQYTAVIVDNDCSRSAEATVTAIKRNCSFDISYIVEPERGISQARNRVVKNVRGAFLAFIDDDEYPSERWLFNLYNTIVRFKADGVLGPVYPYFDVPPPGWLLRSGLCFRKSFLTGTELHSPADTRTGNVLLSMRLFNDCLEPFDKRFGSTGGEDAHFFTEAINRKSKFVWCNEAPVYELVPQSRRTRRYYMQRALLRGTLNARKSKFLSVSTVRSLVAAFCYSFLLPFFLLAGHHHFMKYIVKNCDHIGKLFGLLKIEIVKDRGFVT